MDAPDPSELNPTNRRRIVNIPMMEFSGCETFPEL
jgi:hypothetical protein